MVEILMAIVIISIALLPLVTSGRAVHRQGYFAEHHTMAMIRARSILDLVRSLDYDVLDQLAQSSGSSGEIDIDPKTLLEDGGFSLLFTPVAFGIGVQNYQKKLKFFKEELSFTRFDNDLGKVRVRVTWKDGADRKSSAAHQVVLAQVLHRPEAGAATRVRP